MSRWRVNSEAEPGEGHESRAPARGAARYGTAPARRRQPNAVIGEKEESTRLSRCKVGLEPMRGRVCLTGLAAKWGPDLDRVWSIA
jgi:hypothetical protein